MKYLTKAGRLLAVLTVALSMAAKAQPAGSLWGISLNGFNSGSPGPSSLYAIDPGTGAGTLIGTDLGYAVNSIAIDPTTGIMYASTTQWDTTFGSGLLQVNPVTGTATQIGPTGLSNGARVLTFDSAGQLWGWSEDSDDPIRVNKASGAATVVGSSGVGTGSQVMAFNAADDLVMVMDADVFIIDQVTGTANLDSTLSFDPGSGGAAFNFSSGLLWASGTQGSFMDAHIRVTDIAGDSFTDIDTDVDYLNGVTWGATTAPPTPTSAPIPVMGVWQLFCLIALMGGGALATLRRRFRGQ